MKKNSKGVLLRRQLLKVAPAEATKGKVLLSQSATSAKWGGNDGSREGGGFFILNPMKHIWVRDFLPRHTRLQCLASGLVEC